MRADLKRPFAFSAFHFSIVLAFLLTPVVFYAQSNTVSGTVQEASSGMAIPGVNIIIKGTSQGATTDFDGNYTIDAKKGDVLQFSYIGFITQSIAYTGEPVIDVSLKEDSQKLDAVVVVGYGSTTKKDLTGSVALVSEDDFNKGNNVTAENLLTGRVAGVNINTGGAPGAGSEITIRGGASLNASNSPLIVVDGLPLQNVAGGSRSVLSSINPNDIESFSVLKDASAAAIYGNRGANGVIIITTKKGKQNLRVNFDSQLSIGTLSNTIDVFSADEYRDFIAERFPEQTDLLGDANTDWQDAIYRNTVSTQSNVSVSGSLFGAVPVRASAGHTDQDGLRKTSNFTRSNASLAVNPQFFDGHLKLNLNANLSFEKNRFAENVEGSALSFDPTQPIYDPDSQYGGFYEYTNSEGIITSESPRNPVAQLLQTRNIQNVRRYYGNFKIDYKFHFLPELRAVVNLGLDQSNGLGFFEISKKSALGVNAEQGEFLGAKSDFTSRVSNTLFDGYLVYKKGLGDFNSEITAGYSYQKFESENFTTNEQRDPNAPPADNTIDPDVVLLAYFARGNFNYKRKYFLSASIRRDGTSRFGPEERFGVFPAASVAWQVSDEDFLKDSKVLSNLKLRLGYGITGQQDIFAAGDYLARYRLGNQNLQYLFNGQPVTLTQAQFRNEDIKWEEITEYNAGIDYGFLDGKISGALDFFRKESDDLLSLAPVPDGANFSNQGFQNIGKLITQGVEFSVNVNLVEKEGFHWDVNYNATYINREIDKLAFGQDILTGTIGGGTGNTVQINREGEAPFSYFTFKQLYDNVGNPVEGAYEDVNGDNILNNDDKSISGNGRPDVTMGFLSNVTYKDFDFSFNLRASLGGEIYNNVNSSRAQLGNVFRNFLSNVPTQVLESNFESTPDVILSDYYVEDASFLKMDNITLGYTLDKEVLKTGSLRFWTGIQNVFTVTDYSGLDPEVGGIDNTIYPRPRTFLFGLNYKF